MIQTKKERRHSLPSLTVGNDGSGVIDGTVKFTRTDTASNYRILTGENADTITSQTAMTGATFDQTVEETYLCIEPGEPEDTSKPDVLSYGFKVNGETANENTLPVGLVYANGKLTASTNYTGDLAIEVADAALKLDVSLQSVTGDVTLLGVNDVAITGSDAGGAVAAVLVGGAAVWGGYEITTRVILHNILPEGAAIPANRGQLALLVWNNAGRPEPVNEPAFVDMDDADMAKAAQWCVEQGIMDAKTAETFKPEGWTPKFKVIEVWNNAFPKQ